MRTVAGVATWARIAVLGSVPRESNRTTSTLYLATMICGGLLPLPGTPVFRVEDGACIGLLVPPTTITTQLTAPLCVVAAVAEIADSGP